MSRYMPEFGQAVFGNMYGEYGLGKHEELVCQELYDLSMRLGMRRPEAQAHGALGGEWGYGQDFSNEVFEMHPYWWGECSCEGETHSSECHVLRPNFRYKGFEIRWYKYIGRGMSANHRVVSADSLLKMFRKCRESIV